jgi:hypothetical protein
MMAEKKLKVYHDRLFERIITIYHFFSAFFITDVLLTIDPSRPSPPDPRMPRKEDECYGVDLRDDSEEEKEEYEAEKGDKPIHSHLPCRFSGFFFKHFNLATPNRKKIDFSQILFSCPAFIFFSFFIRSIHAFFSCFI